MSVTIVGSANLDVIQRVDTLPGPGETVLARHVSESPGGKGLNQAIAAARAGAQTRLVTAVGHDPAAETLLDAAAADGIAVSVRRANARTGRAIVTVASNGENAIVVDAGANDHLRDLNGIELAPVAGCGVLLVQLEIPLGTVLQAAAQAHAAGAIVILNAAPARDLPDQLFDAVDVLVVNEHEAAALANSAGQGPAQAAELLTRLAPAVVVTLGADGVLVQQKGDDSVHIPAPQVPVIDTTGAGDTFCGALAAVLDEGKPLELAARFAVAAASLSVQHSGAVPSIPDRASILAAIRLGTRAYS